MHYVHNGTKYTVAINLLNQATTSHWQTTLINPKKQLYSNYSDALAISTTPADQLLEYAREPGVIHNHLNP